MFIGRKEELKELGKVIENPGGRIAVIYGRRRIGKSCLIEQACSGSRVFRFEGLENEGMNAQLKSFVMQLSAQTGESHDPVASWQDAFFLLHRVMGPKKGVIVLDEFQWMANYRSKLVSELKMVWDGYLSKRPGATLILCGSIASFMINKVIKSGALYGRVDYELGLRAFQLEETAELLGRRRGLSEILDAQSVSGGVPKYVELLAQEPSVRLGMERHAFSPNGYLVTDYDRIFVSHFGKNPDFEKIVRALAASPYGLFREVLAKKAGVDLGGGLTHHLEDLEAAGFIRSFRPLDKPANSRLLKYILSDAYIGFYFAFIRPKLKQIQQRRAKPLFASATQSQAYRSWRGRAFEAICIDHSHRIAQRLGFSGIDYEAGPWFRAPRNRLPGVQIDLVFDRADDVITLCEMKRQVATVGKGVIEEVERKAAVLEMEYPRKTIQRVLIADAPISTEVETASYFYQILGPRDLMDRM